MMKSAYLTTATMILSFPIIWFGIDWHESGEETKTTYLILFIFVISLFAFFRCITTYLCVSQDSCVSSCDSCEFSWSSGGSGGGL